MIVNHRKLRLKEYWVSAPLNSWWDGVRFVESGYWPFSPRKFKSHSSNATATVDAVDRVLRLAKVARIKSGDPGKVYYSAIYMHLHTRRKRRRYITDSETMGCTL